MTNKASLSNLSREEIEEVAATVERRLLEHLDRTLKSWPRGTRTRIIERLGASNSLFADLRRSKPNAVPLGKLIRILICINEDLEDFVRASAGKRPHLDVEAELMAASLGANQPEIVLKSRRARGEE